MRITSKQLRQIIREELGRMNESRYGGRHGMSYGYGSFGGGSQGGRDEGWGDDDDDGTGWDFNFKQPWKKGDKVKLSSGIGTIVWADEVSSHVKVEKADGEIIDTDGKYIKRA